MQKLSFVSMVAGHMSEHTPYVSFCRIPVACVAGARKERGEGKSENPRFPASRARFSLPPSSFLALDTQASIPVKLFN